MRTCHGRYLMLAILMALLGMAAVPSAAIEYDLEAHYRRLASVEHLRGDYDGSAYLNALASGERPTHPVLTQSDRDAHPDYMSQYEEVAEGARRAEVWAAREHDSEYAKRVAHSRAELDLVRYELSQAGSATPSIIREHLNKARVWLCYRYIALMAQPPPPPPPPPPAPVALAPLPTISPVLPQRPSPPPPPPPPVTVRIQAVPNVIQEGEPVILSWGSSGADQVIITPGFGSVLFEAKRDLYPKEDVTYVAVATGPGGRAEDAVTITVHPRPAAFFPTPALPVNLGRIYFDFDESAIRNDAVDTLAQVAVFLRDHPEVNLLIEGHTDWIGTVDYNQGLSERRAEATRNYLSRVHGISTSRQSTVGRSELHPIAPNEMNGYDFPTGRQINRHVELLRRAE